jgi:TolB-like protein
MSSIIEGYSYDIFISYRQNDNKYDSWVTEFVDNLNKELEANIKDKISVYFDINPEDGLLETHSVNRSLEDKLKCLIFIPIISRTYCDSKSFAWQHEFVAFNKLAKEDQFGRDIRLIGGNVASRILPIKIHDLDPEDKTLLENELEGMLRSIEFIYKSAGVNRPLRANEDHPQDNLNKTYYRDQINKVANSVKEIITAIKKQDQQGGEISKGVIRIKPEKQKNLKPKIIIVSIIVLALIILGYFFIPKLTKSSKPAEKSIAVLPFKLLSDESDKQYLADGMMEAILLNLSKIKDIRVMSSTSVEQYRATTKTTHQIGKELGVEYLLEGRFQKYGNNVRLIVQLIKARKESHAWADEYDRDWNDVFSVQSEVAQAIAGELHAAITAEEKQIIEKIPTTNLTAYDFYQRGREEHKKFWHDNSNKTALKHAEDLYHKALKYDSTFAQAYTGLASIYWDKHYYEEYFSKNFLDSVLILCDIALSYDNQLSEVYIIRGDYYRTLGISQKAIDEYDKALKINPNSWKAYFGKGYLYGNDNLVKMLENLHKAASLNHGSELPGLLRNIASLYYNAGFSEKGNYYHLEALKLDDDSASYFISLADAEWFNGNFKEAVEFLKKGYAIDSINTRIINLLGEYYMLSGKPEESLTYYKKYIIALKALGEYDTGVMHRIGYAYWKNGYKKEAEYYLNKELEYCQSQIKSDRPYAQLFYTYYDLAAVYAFKGDKDKAYENLKIFNQRQRIQLWMVNLIKNDALFDNIRNEPDFQQIVRDVEAKYKAEHERVRKWLEENKML